MHVTPNEPTLKAPRTKRLKLTHEKLLSNFGFNFNLRRYNKAHAIQAGPYLLSAFSSSGLSSSASSSSTVTPQSCMR